jgi:ribonuclease E
LLSPPPTEHELQAAVADLDTVAVVPPRAEPAEPAGAEEASSHAPHVQTPSEVAPAAEAAREEPPRRRSTVREPAPLAGSEAAGGEGASAPVTPAAPVPEPVITEVDTGESAKGPRRSGWWSRRSAGG